MYPTRMTDYITQYENGGNQTTQSNATLSYTPEQYDILNSWYTKN